MRAFRSTIILAFIVFLVLYISYREYNRQMGEEEREKEQEKIVQHWEQSEVNQIKASGSYRKFQIKKIEGNWHLLEPVSDLASKTKVEEFLRAFFKKKAQVLLSDSDEKKISWSDYGLQDSQYSFELSRQGAKKSSLEEKEKKKHKKHKKAKSTSSLSEDLRVDLSSLKSYDGKHYLRLNQGSDLLIAQDKWSDVTSFDWEGFREKKLFLKSWSPKHFFFQVGRKAFPFQKKEGGWVYIKEESLKLDSSLIDQMINKIRNLKVEEFLSEKIQAETLSKFQLNRPRWVIRWSDLDSSKNAENKEKKSENEEKEWTMKLSPIKNKKIYVKISDREFIGKVSESVVKTWPKTINGFRDKNEAFSFDQKKAFSLSLFWKGKKLEFKKLKQEEKQEGKKEDFKWELLNSKSPEEKVRASGLRSFLRQVSRLKAEDFLKPSSRTHKGKNRLLIQGESGDRLLELHWGQSFSKRGSSNKKERFYTIHSQKIKDVLLVKEKKWEEILDIKLVKKEKQKDLKKDKDQKELKKNSEDKKKASQVFLYARHFIHKSFSHKSRSLWWNFGFMASLLVGE